MNLLYALFSEGVNLHNSGGFFNQTVKQKELVEINLNIKHKFLEKEPVEMNSDKLCSILLYSPNDILNLSPYSSSFEVLRAAIREANSCNL